MSLIKKIQIKKTKMIITKNFNQTCSVRNAIGKEKIQCKICDTNKNYTVVINSMFNQCVK